MKSPERAAPAGGLREKKRKETLQRITDAGIRLFAAQGYEATTLEAIAAEAGISRRTFFHYFKSKDEILLSLQGGLGASLVAMLEEMQPQARPLPALRAAMLAVVRRYATPDLPRIDRLMRSTPAVQARKQAGYAEDERVLFADFQARWPKERPETLRLLAMLCIGVSRISLEAWSREDYARPLAEVLEDNFAAMDELGLGG